MDSPIVELEKDLAELDKFIEQATRTTIKRNLENQRKTIVGLLENEKKIADTKKQDAEKSESTTISSSDEKYNYTSISKYAFENTEKFAK